MAARTTIELVPLLASLLVSAPTWALEPCHAVAGDALQCGTKRIHVRGLDAPRPGTAAGERAQERLQRAVMAGPVRLEAISGGHGRGLVANVYVNEVRLRQKDIGPRPEIDASACKVVDGDSLRCGLDPVRVRGVYAAEKKDTAAHARARDRLERVMQSGEVKLVSRARDRYGRIVADLYVDGRRIRQRDIGPRRGAGSSH